MHGRSRWWAFGLLFALVFAGCMGSGDDEGDPDGADGGTEDEGSDDEDAASPAPAVTLEVSTAGNYPANPGFDPEELAAAAGANVTLRLTNEDLVAGHAWRLEGVEGSGTDVAEPGDTVEVTFVAPEPGEYAFYCPVGNHRQLGQEGTLVVAA